MPAYDSNVQAVVQKARDVLVKLSPEERVKAEALISHLLDLDRSYAEGTESLFVAVKKEHASLIQSAEQADNTPRLDAIEDQLSQL
jgi:hypothetical protein